jgi:hypothetical protein
LAGVTLTSNTERFQSAGNYFAVAKVGFRRRDLIIHRASFCDSKIVAPTREVCVVLITQGQIDWKRRPSGDSGRLPHNLAIVMSGLVPGAHVFRAAKQGVVAYLLVGSTGVAEPLSAAGARRGRRTALTLPLLPPPQKN